MTSRFMQVFNIQVFGLILLMVDGVFGCIRFSYGNKKKIIIITIPTYWAKGAMQWWDKKGKPSQDIGRGKVFFL